MVLFANAVKRLRGAICKYAKGTATRVVASASVHSSLGVQARTIRADPGEGQCITIRRAGWFETTASTEMDTAHRFANFCDSRFIEFNKAQEYDDVDIVAKSSNGATVQEFQITRVWDGPFWKQLNTTGAVDRKLTKDELVTLIHQAIERKGEAKYSINRRKQLILLIDTNPDAIRVQLAPFLRSALKSQLDKVSFKQVWLVGPDQDNTFQLTSAQN